MTGSPRYALVAYVRDLVGEFVEHLRRELHPSLPHLGAHLTVLPPRQLQGSEADAVTLLDNVCGQIEPFQVTLGEVETFIPVTPTVFIRVARGAYKMRDMHDRLITGVLAGPEDWPYMPHLTIVKMQSEAEARSAADVARDKWANFAGSRQFQFRELTFVREREQDCWVDLATVKLGHRLVSRAGR